MVPIALPGKIISSAYAEWDLQGCFVKQVSAVYKSMHRTHIIHIVQIDSLMLKFVG